MTDRNRKFWAAISFVIFVESVSIKLCRADEIGKNEPLVTKLTRIGQVDGTETAEYPRSPFSRDGRRFITIKGDAVRVWDALTLKPVTEPLRHEAMTRYRLTADGNTVFTANVREVRLWDVATSKLRSTTKVTDGKLAFADVNPDGSAFVTIDREDFRTATLWHAGETRPRRIWHEEQISWAEFNPAGAWIVTHGYASPFRIWVAATGREACLPIHSDDNFFTEFRAQFDSNGRRLLVPQRKGFTLVEPNKGRAWQQTDLDDSTYTSDVRFSADGEKIVVLTQKPLDPGPVRIYDVKTGKLEREFGSHLIDCAVAIGGRLALCSPWSHDGNRAELWDVATGTKVQTFEAPGRIEVAHMSDDGLTVLVATDANVTWVWHMKKDLERRGTD